jgi:hypothetical protein
MKVVVPVVISLVATFIAVVVTRLVIRQDVWTDLGICQAPDHA